LTLSEIPALIQDYSNAARQAKTAGFDGVDVHGANGYLLDQSLHDGSNKRDDQYGGCIDNRCRLLLEILQSVIEVWGADRVRQTPSPSIVSLFLILTCPSDLRIMPLSIPMIAVLFMGVERKVMLITPL